MKRILLRVSLCLATLLMVEAGYLFYSHRTSRLDLSKADDAYTAGKSIGIIPASGEIYAEAVGFMDQTLFYQAVVTPDEVDWLARTPEVSRFAAPDHAPLWWSLSLWWHGKNSDMKYFRSDAKWPCLFAFSAQQGLIYGTVESD